MTLKDMRFEFFVFFITKEKENQNKEKKLNY